MSHGGVLTEEKIANAREESSLVTKLMQNMLILLSLDWSKIHIQLRNLEKLKVEFFAQQKPLASIQTQVSTSTASVMVI